MGNGMKMMDDREIGEDHGGNGYETNMVFLVGGGWLSLTHAHVWG